MPSTAQHEERTAGNTLLRMGNKQVLIEPHLPLLTLCLGVLSAVLVLAAVVIGIYCVKASEGLSIHHPNASEIYTELERLQANYRLELTEQEKAQKDLQGRQSSHELLKQQIQLESIINSHLEIPIKGLQTERRKIQSDITHNQANCGRCLPGWDSQGSSCYFYSGSIPQLNWKGSREDCIRRGGDLAVIESWEEQQLLFDLLPKAPPSSRPWWSLNICIFIGLSDAGSEGSWVWVNNMTQHEGYWIPGEPNNHGQGQDCASLFNRGNPRHTWFDDNCDTDLCHFVCEMLPITSQ